MDTTPEYIEQLQNASEIQSEWIRTIGDYFMNPSGTVPYSVSIIFEALTRGKADGVEHYGGTYNMNCLVSKDATWLPRQDQLQTMIYERGYYNYFYHHARFTKFLNENFKEFLTYEQVWLAYVMHVKYGKQWDSNTKTWV